MKHLKKTALITAALLLCLSGTAGAEYIDSAYYDYSADSVKINGRFFDDSNDTYATVLVIMEGGGSLDRFDDRYVMKQDQVKIKDGKFEFSFPLAMGGSKYTAYVEAGGAKRETTFTHVYNIKKKVSDILAQTTAEDFAKKIDSNADALNISDTVYGKLSDKLAAGKLLFSEKDKINDADALRDMVKAYAYMQALNESKSSLLLDGSNIIDEKTLGFDTIDKDYNVSASSLYNSSIKDSGRMEVFKKMENQSFKDLDTMKKAFIYNTTIAAIKYNKNSGTSHIKTILNDNNAVNGFDLTNYSKTSGNAIDLSLINGSEWEKRDIQKLLNATGTSKDDSRGDVGTGGNSKGNTATGGKSGNYSQNYPVMPEKEEIHFNDIDENTEWARESIEKLVSKGIVNGRDKNMFAPSDSVKRAEFLKMLILVFDLKAENAEDISFEDVTAEKWYYDVVKTASALNIAKGYGNGYFGANDSITRQDAAVMMMRAAAAVGFEFSQNEEMIDFEDKADIAEYAAEATEKLVKSGILHGDDNGYFKPSESCTRAQAAVMLANILGQLEAKEG